MKYKSFYPAKVYRWTTYPLSMMKEMIIARRNNRKDNIVLVTGGRGEGKSTFTGKVLFQFEDFNPYEQIVYTKEAMYKQVKKKLSYVWGDESIINVARGNVMTRGNKLLHELFTISRSNYNTVFLLLPFVEDFDAKILQYCSMWVHIDRRGLGVLMLPSNKGIFGKRNWDIDHMKKIYDEFVKENKGERHMPYWVYDNFRGYIRFGKLTQKQEEIINEIKELRKNENLDSEMKEVKVKVDEMKNYVKYTVTQLAEMIGKEQIRDLNTLSKTCEEMKVDPNEMIKKVDAVFRLNKIGKTVKGLFREYHKKDSLINF